MSGNAELKWIYDAAKEIYKELFKAQQMLQGTPRFRLVNDDSSDSDGSRCNSDSPDPEETIWIHVGDDLTYDAGGSAQSGALIIWLELDENQFKQTARQLFDDDEDENKRRRSSHQHHPRWITSTPQEIKRRRILNPLALDKVDERVRFLSRLLDAVQDVVDRVNREGREDALPRIPTITAA